MTVLHIINASPSKQTGLISCLRLRNEEDTIIFIEDAVWALDDRSEFSHLIRDLKSQNIYVLEGDLQARGLDDKHLLADVKKVDYAGFVRLTVQADGVQSWV